MIHTSIDLARSGKQQGFLQVPYSHNLGGWANVMVPMTVIARGEGPTVLCLGGNHGDEYQGQVAIMRLAREVAPEQVSGRLILVPSLNMPAAKAATRALRMSSSRRVAIRGIMISGTTALLAAAPASMAASKIARACIS